MKFKKLFLALFFLCAVLHGQSQTMSFGRAFSFGDAFITDKDQKSKFLLASTGGVSLNYSNNEHYGAGLDFVYSNEGGNSEDLSTGTLVKTEIKLTYLRLPIKFIYFFGETGDIIRPKIFAGPTIGYLTSAEINDNGAFNQFERWDFGAHIGIGANKNVCDRIWFNTDVTYTQGFRDITNTELNNDKNLNGNIRINLSLMFGIGK